jgi:hypothetical protein
MGFEGQIRLDPDELPKGDHRPVAILELLCSVPQLESEGRQVYERAFFGARVCGPRYAHLADCRALRGGHAADSPMLDGQRVKV